MKPKTPSQQKPQLLADEKYEEHGVSLKSSQLNWYDLETKCKKLVFDIVQPQVQNMAGFSQKLQEIETSLSGDYTKRLEDLEFFILRKRRNQKAHPTLIDQTNDRLQQVETELKSSIATLQDQLSHLSSEDQRQATHLSKLDIQHSGYLQRFDLFESQTKHLLSTVNESKKEIFQMVSDRLQSHDKTIDEIASVQKHLQLAVSRLEMSLSEISTL